jgi:hypothetical protein
MQTPIQDIQLEGKVLADMRLTASEIERNLVAFSHRVLALLYGDDHTHRCKAIKVLPNNTRIAILDEKLKVIGVWENPPGVCRRPRKGEKFD